MGLNPLRVNYLAQAAEFLENGTPEPIVHLKKGYQPLHSHSRFCRSLLTCAFRFDRLEIPRIFALGSEVADRGHNAGLATSEIPRISAPLRGPLRGLSIFPDVRLSAQPRCRWT
jgi:hypothetical protein